MPTVLLGVTGGIAAYKAIDTLRALRRAGHDVQVVMTQAAQRFVGAASFAALSGNRVGTGLFGSEDTPDYRHLDLARSSDLMLVAPASANTIGRMAAGLADDLLTSCYLAFDGPVLVAPAMNTRMWEHPATRANLATLAARGTEIIPPGEGLLADGDVGAGRLAETEDIVAAVVARLAARTGPFVGRRVLVTAGGTREPIDSVRFVGNRSSGRMGFALAEAARRRGAEVTIVAANVDLPRRADISYVDVQTAAQMLEATRAAFADCDVLVMSAAVADYRPVESRDGKIDKSASDRLDIALEPTVDILASLATARTRQVLVGFAAEHGEGGLARARDKRARKGLDVIVHNDVAVEGVGFEGDDNAVTIIGPADEEQTVSRTSKAGCAERILDVVAPLLARDDTGSR
jgi:phosphopantothenoylcysteine decarboxylase/phosphopantothenate--cysteine ligase